MLYKTDFITKHHDDVFVDVGREPGVAHTHSELLRFKFNDGRVEEYTGEFNFRHDASLELQVKRRRHDRIASNYILPYSYNNSNVRIIEVNIFTGARRIKLLNPVVMERMSAINIALRYPLSADHYAGKFIFTGEAFKPVVSNGRTLNIYNRVLKFEEVING